MKENKQNSDMLIELVLLSILNTAKGLRKFDEIEFHLGLTCDYDFSFSNYVKQRLMVAF